MKMIEVRTLGALLLFAGALGGAPSCSSKAAEGTDSNTHWLDQCTTDADCGGLSCECGICTKSCSTPGDCGHLGANVACHAVAGCSTETSVCLSGIVDGGVKPVAEGGSPTSGGVCPATVFGGDICDGRIAQCFTACSGGFRSQHYCGLGVWSDGKGLFPCDPSTCADGIESQPCDGSVDHCFTQCAGGFQTQYACSGGAWIAGHGLFPCGPDGGVTDAGTHPVTSPDAGVPTPERACTRSADCVAADSRCCECGVPTLSDKIGVSAASSQAYEDALCSDFSLCPPCEPLTGTIESFCTAGTCDVEDLAKYKACTRDADCTLAPKDCCACGALPLTAFVAISDAGAFAGSRCATVDCAACLEGDGPHVADASRATCNTTVGYCEVAPTR